MRRTDNILTRIDWLTVILYLVIVLLGWLNIYAAVYEEAASIFDFSLNSGRQLAWIGASMLLIIIILSLDFKFFDAFGYIIYASIILLLILVLVFGREIAGSKSWLYLGGFGLQPSEFAKFATAIAIAKFLKDSNTNIEKPKNLFYLTMIIGAPTGLIALQGDTGTALVFTTFILVFYREGLSPFILLIGILAVAIFILTLLVDKLYLGIGIGLTALLIIILGKKSFKRIAFTIIGAALIFGVSRSVDYVFTSVLKPHQQNRIRALINPDADPLGYGWNVTQSKIAIGSGGMWGKGFLNGTQTKYDFVPEQSTDFIFCTIGEEHGWIGSLILISLFILLLLRIIYISERQKMRFARVYGYGVASILFFHFAVNIGMTIGLFPVIGIPLPFFSYGGSSLWAFTILLFILIKLDAHRMDLLLR